VPPPPRLRFAGGRLIPASQNDALPEEAVLLGREQDVAVTYFEPIEQRRMRGVGPPAAAAFRMAVSYCECSSRARAAGCGEDDSAGFERGQSK